MLLYVLSGIDKCYKEKWGRMERESLMKGIILFWGLKAVF